MTKELVEKFYKFDEYELNTLEIEKKAHYAKDNYYANFNVIGFANDDDASIVKGTVTHYIDEWYYEDRIYDYEPELCKAWKEMYGIKDWSKSHMLHFYGENGVKLNLEDFTPEYCAWALLRMIGLEMQQFPAYKDIGIAIQVPNEYAQKLGKIFLEITEDKNSYFYDWLHDGDNALKLTFDEKFAVKKLKNSDCSVLCMTACSSRFEANIDLESTEDFDFGDIWYDFNGIGSTWY